MYVVVPMIATDTSLNTPIFIVDEERIRKNCEVLASVRKRTGCKVLRALKGFAMWPLFPMIREDLDVTCASSPWEARLGREEFIAGASAADLIILPVNDFP